VTSDDRPERGKGCSDPEAYERARAAIDALHRLDPQKDAGGQPAELLYADHVEAWTKRLFAQASPLLLLAARCQHLERWSVPRATFPEGRAGYLAWRQRLYVTQAQRAEALLLEAGVNEEEAQAASLWVSKTGLRRIEGTQVLQDAAVLVFLEREIGAFVAQRGDYPREKFLNILKKTWRKLSPAGQAATEQVALPEALAQLFEEAKSGGVHGPDVA